jgi:hypothetical protein
VGCAFELVCPFNAFDGTSGRERALTLLSID